MNNRLTSFTFFIVSTVIICYALIVAKNLLMPLIVAILLWHLFNTLAVYIKGIYGVGRYIPYTICLLLALFIIGSVIYKLASILTDNVGEVIVRAPQYQENLKAILSGIDTRFKIKLMAHVNDFFSTVSFQSILLNIYGTFTIVTSSAFLIALYVGFLFLEQRVMRPKLEALFPQPKHLSLANKIINQIVSDTQTYVGIKSAMSLITALSSWIIMKSVGLDFSEFWALLIFFLNFIPNIGSVIATIFPSLLALIQFQTTWWPFIVISCGIIVVQFIVGNLIEPRFLSKQLNLSPLVILISLGIWGQLWGILGMFLSVPIMVILMIIFSNFEKTKPVAILLSQNGSIRHDEAFNQPTQTSS